MEEEYKCYFCETTMEEDCGVCDDCSVEPENSHCEMCNAKLELDEEMCVCESCLMLDAPVETTIEEDEMNDLTTTLGELNTASS